MKMKLGLGGGCHWCTEAVFQSIKGVYNVEQGWICSTHPYETPSEGVIVHFDDSKVSMELLIRIHLQTHSSESNHSMREKYRSAIYTFNDTQSDSCRIILDELSSEFSKNLVTLILPMKSFNSNEEKFLNYYSKNKQAPFCKRHIIPKLEQLIRDHGNERVKGL
ncbi:MAG: peptide-methionine (S)-S-oxide reductase [Bacteriovoracaceae bacterium]|nr:peptide-methionine (S)-S-oxide reductase [Bacteriovoracaceae bacterium]